MGAGTYDRRSDARFRVEVEPAGENGGVRASFGGVDDSRRVRAGSVEVAALGYVTAGRGTTSERVLSAYQTGGLRSVTELDGSFLAVIADQKESRVLAITDVTSSRAGYLGEKDGRLTLANSLRQVDCRQHPLDAGGIASYLASDGCHGLLTPYSGVHALAPGTITELRPGAVTTDRYWRSTPRPSRSIADFAILRDEMIDLMRDSVRHRLAVTNPEQVAISLSGGVDSRGLLGMLLEHLSPDRISALTYYHGEQVGDMDLPEARRIARLGGVEHRAVRGYLGDLPALVAYNALHGEGVAHFCDEADVWRTLEAEGDFDAMVVGDRQAHHQPSLGNLTTDQLLRVVSVFSPEAVGWFLERLDGDSAAALHTGWERRYEEIRDEYASFGPWEISVHPAYIEERMSRTLALWRERFSSQAGVVLNPYLDRRLLDFVSTLPLELNDVEGRFLHREAIVHAWPEVAGGLVSAGGWNAPSWGTEIQRHAPALRHLVTRVDSRLEELIPKAVVLDLVAEVERHGSSLLEATEGVGWRLRKAVKRSRILSSAVRRVKGRTKLEVSPRVDRAGLTRRLLTMHLALADPQEVEAATGLDRRSSRPG